MDRDESVINIDVKRLAALTITLILGVSVFYSYIIALFAFVAPSQGNPLHINSAVTTDSTGSEKTSFKRGDIVCINVNLEHATGYYWNAYSSYEYYYSFSSPSEYLLMVQVMKGSTPIFLGFVNQPVSPGGAQTIGVGYRVDDSASLGTYTAFVYVWSDWLPDGSVLADNSGQEVSYTIG